MSAYLMHSDANVYDQPLEFFPERWLGTPTSDTMRNFVPFARGETLALLS